MFLLMEKMSKLLDWNFYQKKTEEIRILDNISKGYNIAFDGRYIYYVGDKLILTKYDTVSEDCIEMTEIITEKFLFLDSKILFINRIDNDKIYAADLEGNIIQKLTDKSALWFTYDNKYIYFTDKVDLKEYSIER